jgi:hypothetical protein
MLRGGGALSPGGNGLESISGGTKVMAHLPRLWCGLWRATKIRRITLRTKCFSPAHLQGPRARANRPTRLRSLFPAAKILILLCLDELPFTERPSKQDECPIAFNQQ